VKRACALALLTALTNCSSADSAKEREEPATRGAALLLEPNAAAQSPDWVSDAISASDRIVIGRVADVQGEPRGPAGESGVYTRIRVAIERTLLGSEAESVEFWVEGGHTETRARVVSLQARFAVGEEVLVFLAERRGALRLTQMGLGKWTRVAGLRESFAPDIHVAHSVATRIELRAEDFAQRIELRRVR